LKADLKVNEAVTIPGADLSWRAVRSSGPGGQNVNKVSTKVELRFDLGGTRALDEGTKARLRELAGASRFDAEGKLMITSERTRAREQNLADARNKLAFLIFRALTPPKPRKPTKVTKGAKRRRVADKRKVGEKKTARKGGKLDD
jgi:ribosome-associated protein